MPLAALLGLALVLMALRAWTDRQLSAPIAQDYAALLDTLADGSARARVYRASYFHHFARPTVAARHFEQVCATMLRMAESDGWVVPSHSAPMARGCRQHQPRYGGDALPRD